MLTWLIQRKIDGFESEFSYDMDYMRELVSTSLKATRLYHRATALGTFREGLPDDAWYAARILASRSEDCGPCIQLVTTMAERDGVSSETIRAVLTDELDRLPDDARLSARFTSAVLRRDPEADLLRREVVARFGPVGLVSLAFAMISSRLYPTLKYALGYGHHCSVIRVAGDSVLTPQGAG